MLIMFVEQHIKYERYICNGGSKLVKFTTGYNNKVNTIMCLLLLMRYKHVNPSMFLEYC